MKAPEGVQSLAGGIGGKIVRARANVMALCTDTCTHTHTRTKGYCTEIGIYSCLESSALSPYTAHPTGLIWGPRHTLDRLARCFWWFQPAGSRPQGPTGSRPQGPTESLESVPQGPLCTRISRTRVWYRVVPGLAFNDFD